MARRELRNGQEESTVRFGRSEVGYHRVVGRASRRRRADDLDTQPDIHDYIKAHIPGAVYLSEKTLRVPFHGTQGKLTLASCGTGREATNEYILFKYFLGYPRVKLYEGSYTEWTSYADNAAVVGMDTRQAT